MSAHQGSDATTLAAAVAEELAGVVTDVVVCPGSRNAPLILALHARADLRVHVRIDERSAAFLALGMARITRRHVAVCMTSGTAVANCLPAMVEAAQSHTPLLVLSADRPERLYETGASQTIRQQGLFANYTPTLQVGSADDARDQRAGIAAWLRAHPQAHINVTLDNPLVTPELCEPTGTPRTRLPRPVVPAVDRGEVPVDLGLQTLVIAGDEAWEVPGLEEVPTIAEPSAPAPLNPVHPLAAGELEPEQVVVVGHPTLDRRVLELAAGSPPASGSRGAGEERGFDNHPTPSRIRVVVLSRTDTVTDPEQVAAAVGSRVAVTGAPSGAWLSACEEASQRAAERVRAALADPSMGLTGLHAAAAIVDTLGEGDTVFAAASNPVRDLSWSGLPTYGNRVCTPRGAAGIDGSVSQAIGAALAIQAAHPDLTRAPRVVALLGDLAFLHDAPGLAIGPDEPRPENLTLVVSNDDGGGIFETLEVGAPAYREAFDRLVATPHGTDFAALCAAYGIEHTRVTELTELEEALAEAADHPRFHVIEVRTQRAHRRDLAQAVGV